MMIAACGALLACELGKTGAAAPEGTPSERIAKTILGMAQAYADDGVTFNKTGDPVNALAAFYYGFGWLHFGQAYGMISGPQKIRPSCPFSEPCEILDERYSEKLAEKTRRYERLLRTARAAVEIAPEPGTDAHDFAARVLVIADAYAGRGLGMLADGAFEDALAHFSYGHGWMDAAVRTGLFWVKSDRALFTV